MDKGIRLIGFRNTNGRPVYKDIDCAFVEGSVDLDKHYAIAYNEDGTCLLVNMGTLTQSGGVDHSNEIKQIQDTLETLKASVLSIETSITAIKKDTAANKTLLTTHTSDITKIKSDITALNNIVNSPAKATLVVEDVKPK